MKRIHIHISMMILCTLLVVFMASCEDNLNKSTSSSNKQEPKQNEVISNTPSESENIENTGVADLNLIDEESLENKESLERYKKALAKHEKSLKAFTSKKEASTFASLSDTKKGKLYYDIGVNKGRVAYFKSRIDYIENIREKSPDDATVKKFNDTTIKDLMAAIASLTEAIKLDDRHTMSYTKRGKLKIRLALFELGIQDQEQKENFIQGKLGELQEDFDKAIKINKSSSPPYFYRSMVYAISSHIAKDTSYTKALEDIEKAIKIAPGGYPEYDFMKSLIFAEMNNKAKMCESQKKTIEMLTKKNTLEECPSDGLNNIVKLLAKKNKYMLYLEYIKNRK